MRLHRSWYVRCIARGINFRGLQISEHGGRLQPLLLQVVDAVEKGSLSPAAVRIWGHLMSTVPPRALRQICDMAAEGSTTGGSCR